MLYPFISYLKFLWRSTNQHGIHSPFVYDLVTKCFYDRANFPEYQTLNSFRKKISNASETIEVTDFGEGSRVFSSNKRRISEIAKHAGISKKRQQTLFRIVNYFNSKTILELGTSVGLATTALSLGNTKGKVITIEGCPNTAKTANHYFDLFQLTNIELHQKKFETFFLENPNSNFDLVYIDGNHNKEKTLQHFEEFLKSTSAYSVLIFDDIYWSKPMTEAWDIIRNHNKVSVSIDMFYWGIVFFRTEQQKEHFTIRM